MRNIFIVNASQVIISDSHPEGLFSIVSGFPQYFDSRSYNPTEQNPNGDESVALSMAKSAYHAQLSANEANTNPNRVMTMVSLLRADGRLIMSEAIGAFPDMTPEPEPEPEPEPDESI